MGIFGKKNPPTPTGNSEELQKKRKSLERELEEIRKQEQEELDRKKQKEAEKEKSIQPDSDSNQKEEPMSLEVLQKELTAKDDEIKKLKEQLENFEKNASRDDNNPDNPESASAFADIQSNLKTILSLVSQENSRLVKENTDLENRLDEKQMRVEQIVQVCQEDRYRKDKVKLINKYVYHIDLIRKTLFEFAADRKKMQGAKAVDFLVHQLEELVIGMDATLQQEMVEIRRFGKPGDAVNLDMQEVIGSVPTDDSSLDGKIQHSVSPAYIWTLPYILKAKVTDNGDEIKSYNFLLRAEQIIVYKFNKDKK